MSLRKRDSALLGLFLFVIASTGMSIAVAVVYARGVERVEFDALSYPGLRVMARPTHVAVGHAISQAAVAEHLVLIGYSKTLVLDDPGTFTVSNAELAVSPRYHEFPAVTVRWDGTVVTSILDRAGAPLNEVELEPETIMAFEPDGWTTMLHNEVAFAMIEGTVLEDALVASEDKDFWIHHGLDFLRLAFVPVLGGGASTLTMQLARLNVLRDRSRTFSRKAAEIGVAMALERRYTKRQLLHAYLNAAYLGTSRGRQVRGFAAAAKEFFGVTDLRHLDLTQAATLVAMLNQPARYLADLRQADDTLLRRQRNRVLRLMLRNRPDRYESSTINAIESTPVVFHDPPQESLLEASSEWYLDSVAGDVVRGPRTRVYVSLDADLQRHAEEVVGAGLLKLEEQFPSTRSRLQAALVAIDPETAELVAMTGGRSHDQSQFNRATSARRQIGSLIKGFVLAAAIERAAEGRRTDITPASIVIDAPTTFFFGGRPWRPANYGHQYSGPMTARRAIALSRNVPAVKIAAYAGLDRLAEMWYHATGTAPTAVYPSLALGAIEETPLGVATAYAALANGGVAQPIVPIQRVVEAGTEVPARKRQARRVMREDVAFVVANTLQAVLDEGTAIAARSAGFTMTAAGKTGTTDDLRDAWFVGFRPHLLAVVWVGADDNRPIGLTGAQAALPIWTEFMKRTGVLSMGNFEVPDGVTFAEIDSETGLLATPGCRRRVQQAFLAGTQPVQFCKRHR